MILKRLGILGLLAAVGIGTSACTSGYGYGGGSLGYASGGYYDDGYYDGFGGGGFGGVGFASNYYGWNNGFYYPGTGVYVYDRNRRPFRWNGAQQRYWQGRGLNRQGSLAGLNRQDRREVRQNWQGFRQDRRQDTRAFRQDRRVDRQAFRSGQVTRPEFRAERRQDRQGFRQERRQDTRQVRRANRRAVRN